MPNNITRRAFLSASAVGVPALLATANGKSLIAKTESTAALPPIPNGVPKPNIILINCHDLGRHLGCYGVTSVKSPNIDALAAEGVRFAGSFCVAPQCSPSRATIMTGQYPQTHGVMGLAHANFAWSMKPTSRHLAAHLREAGWHTALIGGQHEMRDIPAMGFDEMTTRGLFRPCEEAAALCIDFLARRRQESKPFYLQLGFFEPHRPWSYGDAKPESSRGISVPPYLVDDAGARGECAAIQGAISSMDHAVGRVLTAIKGMGLMDNSLVIFTTDHGIAFPRAKCSVYDPGLETCLIMRWPGAKWAAAGHVIPNMISNVDYFPTIFDLAGLSAPAQAEGRSFAALLRGQAYQQREEIFAGLTYHDYYDPRRCIRTNTHKLIINFSNAYSFMDPSQKWFRHTITKNPPEPAFSYHVPVELYDLRADPDEFTNLAAAPESRGVKRDLLIRLHRWLVDTHDPILEGIPISPMHRMALAALEVT